MLHLKLVPDNGFPERKGAVVFLGQPEKNFGDLFIRLNRLPFLYTTESHWGRYHFDRQFGDWEFHEGYLNFGLDCSGDGKQFLEGVKDIVQKYRDDSHLAHSYPFHSRKRTLHPNEFHLGVVPSNGKPVEKLDEIMELASEDDCKAFLATAGEIWGAWGELAARFEKH